MTPNTRLCSWLDIVQRELEKAAPRNDEAKEFAEECRALIPQIVWYSVFPSATMEETSEAMLAAMELGFAIHAFAISNELGSAIRSGLILSDAGRRGAAKRHGSAEEKKTLRKWAKIQRRCSELVRAGIPKAKVLKTLSHEFGVKGVKPSTLEKNLRGSGHLPRIKRKSSP